MSDNAVRKTEEAGKKAEEERKKAGKLVDRIIGDKEREIIERLNRKNNGTI